MTPIAPDQTTLGFIGIGLMGQRIAQRLLNHGYELVAFDRDVAKAATLAGKRATRAGTVAELASHARVILSSLTDDEAALSVYTGAEGVFAHARRGTLIIEMSTVRPGTSRELHRIGSKQGVDFLDVTVSGSTPAAEQGTLILFGGGNEEAFRVAEPIFRAIAKQYFYMGPSGSGAMMKLVVNTLLGVGIQAIAEAVALGQKAGLDRNRLLDVLAQTAVVAPALTGKLERAKRNDYSPQFPLRLMNKDFRLILEAAAAIWAPMPTAAAAFQVNIGESAVEAEEDFSAVIRHMEKLARSDSPIEEWQTVAKASAS